MNLPLQSVMKLWPIRVAQSKIYYDNIISIIAYCMVVLMISLETYIRVFSMLIR